MKVYIAGKITGDRGYRDKFKAVEKKLVEEGYTPMNPAVLPDGFDYEEYMRVCFAMLDTCEGVCLLWDHGESPGAKRELSKARRDNKRLFIIDEDHMEIKELS